MNIQELQDKKDRLIRLIAYNNREHNYTNLIFITYELLYVMHALEYAEDDLIHMQDKD